jgi:hypothetical protein
MLFYNSLCCAKCLIVYGSLQERNGTDICICHTRTKFAFILHFLMDHCRKTKPMKVSFMGVWWGGREKPYAVNPLVDPGGSRGIGLCVTLHSSKTASRASHSYSKEPPYNFL